jgi:membrane protein implicated in regulation of membrane protease activity
MTVVIVLLALSALIGFGLGTFFWFAIAASSAGIAALSSAILHIQGFGAIPGIAIVVALRPGRLFEEQADKEPSQCRNEDIGYEEQQQQRSPSATVG